MNSKDYIELAKVTETKDYNPPAKRVDEKTARLLHGLMGVASEAGELLSPLKAHIFYGRELDKVHLKEEMGDIFWFLAIACNALDLDFEDVWEANIAKLKARYGEKFSEHCANNRNLKKERKVLEKKKK